jgi:hypothetical protein
MVAAGASAGAGAGAIKNADASNANKKKLAVTITHAEGLTSVETFTDQDPYVACTLQGETPMTARTKANEDGGVAPAWDEVT